MIQYCRFINNKLVTYISMNFTNQNSILLCYVDEFIYFINKYRISI